jgi:hypothetical protein
MKKIILIATILFITTNFLSASGSLTVYLQADKRSVESGKTLKVNVNFNKAVVGLLPTDFSIDGGNVTSVRKISPKNYTAFVMASDDVKTLDVQIEAEKLAAVDGSVNSDSSNSLIIKVTKPGPTKEEVAAQERDNTKKRIDDLLNDVISTTNKNTQALQQAQAQTQAQQIQNTQTQQAQYYNCNGSPIPITQQCNNLSFNQDYYRLVYDYDLDEYYYERIYSNPAYYTPSYLNNYGYYGTTYVSSPVLQPIVTPIVTPMANPNVYYYSQPTTYYTYPRTTTNRILNSLLNWTSTSGYNNNRDVEEY